MSLYIFLFLCLFLFLCWTSWHPKYHVLRLSLIHDPPPFINPNQRLPNIVFRTSTTRMLPPSMFEAYQSMDWMPQWLMNREECRELIVNHFPPEYVKAYDTVIPGAYKADLWRLCVLYMYGGFYMDISLCCVAPFPEHWLTSYECILVEDDWKKGIYNAFMAFEKGHFLLRWWLEDIVDRILRHDYGRDALDITGPQRLASVFREKFLRGQKYHYGDNTIHGMRFLMLWHKKKRRIYDHPRSPTLLLYGHPDYDKERSRIHTRYYGTMWKQRTVFVPSSSNVDKIPSQ